MRSAVEPAFETYQRRFAPVPLEVEPLDPFAAALRHEAEEVSVVPERAREEQNRLVEQAHPEPVDGPYHRVRQRRLEGDGAGLQDPEGQGDYAASRLDRPAIRLEADPCGRLSYDRNRGPEAQLEPLRQRLEQAHVASREDDVIAGELLAFLQRVQGEVGKVGRELVLDLRRGAVASQRCLVSVERSEGLRESVGEARSIAQAAAQGGVHPRERAPREAFAPSRPDRRSLVVGRAQRLLCRCGELRQRVLLDTVDPGGSQVDGRSLVVDRPDPPADPVTRLDDGHRATSVSEQSCAAEPRGAGTDDDDRIVGPAGCQHLLGGAPAGQERAVHRRRIVARGRFAGEEQRVVDGELEGDPDRLMSIPPSGTSRSRERTDRRASA